MKLMPLTTGRLITDLKQYSPIRRTPVITDEPVLSCVHGDNSELIGHVARLYLRQGMTVCDVTYGRGIFWQRTDMTQFDFRASDISPQGKDISKMDFRELKYDGESVDACVFDPPYLSRSGKNSVYARHYKTELAGKNYDEMMGLYEAGMKDCHRVLKKDGLLMVKCADEIQTSRFRPAHCDVLNVAMKLGMEAIDLFVLMRNQSGMVGSPAQRHSRRNHSYLWVFAKVQGTVK
ncbi:MAG: DNA methyltransferase [bacterium]